MRLRELSDENKSKSLGNVTRSASAYGDTKYVRCVKLLANGRNNSRDCSATNVGSCYVRVGSGVQTDAAPRRPCVMRVLGPKNVGRALGRAVQTDPTLLRYASVITETNEMLAQNFDQFEILRNKMQQGVQTDATCNIQKCW